MFQRSRAGPRLACATVLAMTLLSSIALRHAVAADESHLAALVNYGDVDSARRVDGRALGATFLYGHAVSQALRIEARMTGLVLERGGSGTDFYQQDLGVDARWSFPAFHAWKPFALAGISVIRNDVDIAAEDDVGVAAQVGAGLLSPVLGNSGVRFRAEVRYIHDSYLDGMRDLRVGVGLEIPLGSRNAPVRPAVAGRSPDDSDADGVADDADHCPNSLPYVKHDAAGCMQPGQTLRLYDVTFDNGTAVLTPSAREELTPIVLALRGQPGLRIRIDGHTDSLGDADLNRELSRERADAVATYFVLQGIATQRISTRGFGESRPVAPNGTAEGRARNRRIEVVLLPPLQ